MKDCVNKFTTSSNPKHKSLLTIALMIGVLLGVLLAAFIMLYRWSCKRHSRSGFARAYYKSANTQDFSDL